MKTYHLGLDLGGTKFSGMLLDNEGRELSYRETPVRNTWKPRELSKLLTSLAEDVAGRGHVKTKKIRTIGIGVPGIVNEKGEILKIINLPALERVNLRTILPRVKTSIYNDAVCACYAESVLGTLAHASNGVHLMLGTGLGSAVMTRLNESGVFGNQSVLQVSNIEIGHIAANIQAAVTGSYMDEPYELEAYCSRKYFKRNTRMPMKEIYEEYLAGDPGSQDLFVQYGVNIGSLLATVETIYRPDTIVLGGGMTAYYNAFKRPMELVFHERRFLLGQPAKVRLSAFGPEVGALGAALYGMLKR